MKERQRCAWARDAQMIEYHDREWGVPVHDDRLLFEFLILEGAQAGLSWATILKKREAYRKAFAGFDPSKVARFGEQQTATLMANPGIVRNRLKVEGAAKNARAFLAVRKEFGSFDAYIWSFTGGRTLDGARDRMEDVPARSAESDAMSKDLKRRGFTFVGS
ncbi:MAG TPA: DNA-3-methyladenine glycosylase I, partial [Bryobacteraceae bacterium]|nr:DNA-3-methyladenine glycosylase I [Bryobacteraceae bacterium]